MFIMLCADPMTWMSICDVTIHSDISVFYLWWHGKCVLAKGQWQFAQDSNCSSGSHWSCITEPVTEISPLLLIVIHFYCHPNIQKACNFHYIYIINCLNHPPFSADISVTVLHFC